MSSAPHSRVGYNLTLVRKDIFESSHEILELVKSQVRGSKLVSDVSAEISFQLPMESIRDFPALFLQLDERKEELGLQTYGIQITTMEEVFLRVAHLDNPDHNAVESVSRRASLVAQPLEVSYEQVDDFDLNSIRIQNACRIYVTHFWALILKRIRYFKRDLKGIVCELLLPCLLILVGLLIISIDFVIER